MWISREKYESAIELAKMESQEVERKKLHNRLADYEAREMVANDNLNKANAQIKELQGKIREQSKSDMLYEAIHVILTAIKAEAEKEDIKKPYNDMKEAQRSLLSVMAGASSIGQSASYNRQPNYGLFGNLIGF